MIVEWKKLENEVYSDWSDHVFRYCDFVNIDTEGCSIESVLVGCTFERCEFYLALFNGAILVNVKFKNCTFRGVGFAGSKFIECEFIDCVFKSDNLGGECYFRDNAWYQCAQKNCGVLDREFEASAGGD